MQKVPFGPLAEGKTKQIFPFHTIVRQTDIVSWGNKNKEALPGKAEWSNQTACNVFNLFKSMGMEKTAYIRSFDECSFVALYCDMIPLEVVGRSVIDPKSSYLKRNPDFPQDQIGVPLKEPIIEFFLKTKGRQFKGIELPDDDPLVAEEEKIGPVGFMVCHPSKPDLFGLTYIPAEAFGFDGKLEELFRKLRERMTGITCILRDAWAKLGWTLGDVKAEFGIDFYGQLLLADVIDNDSWRLRDPDGVERSKQNVRDGKPVKDCAWDYQVVATMSRLLAS